MKYYLQQGNTKVHVWSVSELYTGVAAYEHLHLIKEGEPQTLRKNVTGRK